MTVQIVKIFFISIASNEDEHTIHPFPKLVKHFYAIYSKNFSKIFYRMYIMQIFMYNMNILYKTNLFCILLADGFAFSGGDFIKKRGKPPAVWNDKRYKNMVKTEKTRKITCLNARFVQ